MVRGTGSMATRRGGRVLVEAQSELLKRRITGGSPGKRLRAHVEMFETSPHHARLRDRGHHVHPATATRTAKGVNTERPLHHQRPVEAPRPGEQLAVLQTPPVRGR